MTPIKLANRTGIPCLEVQNVNTTSTNVVFQFAEHPYFRANFQGLFLIRVSNYTAPSSALPIQFETIGVSGSQINLTTVGGTAVTSSTLASNGIYLVFYDRPTNVLQILSRTA